MLPATHASSVAGVFTVSALFTSVALSRVVGTVPSRGEAAVAALGSVSLTVAAALLVRACRATERAEEARTKRERACQAQRNATIAAYALVLVNGVPSALLLVAAFGAGGTWARDALSVYAAMLPLMATWYLASTVPFPPKPRQPAPVEPFDEAPL